MEHSVTFGGKHTWNDWHLIPASRPTIVQPKLKTQYVDVPGLGSSEDFSELLSGHPIYSDRTGDMEFVVLHDYWDSWDETRTTIANHLTGKNMQVILDDDPTHYYYGRCYLDEYRSEPNYSRIVINYTLKPFKYMLEIPKELRNINVNGEKTITIRGTASYDSPAFIVSGSSSGLYISFDDLWFHAPNGETMDSRIVASPGEHKIRFQGVGTVTVNYKEGVL